MIDKLIQSDVQVVVRVRDNMWDTRSSDPAYHSRLPSYTHTAGSYYVDTAIIDGVRQVSGGVIYVDLDLAEARAQYGADVTLDELMVHEYTHAYRNIFNTDDAYREWYNSDQNPDAQEYVPIDQTRNYVNYRNRFPGNRPCR